MKNFFTPIAIMALAVLGIYTGAAEPEVTIHIVGDSTCANYSGTNSRRSGWGQVLNTFCKPEVNVNNQALSGYSSTSYINKKRWEKLIANVKPGDYVIIQFGHNDGKKGERFADVKTTYPANYRKFITEVRAKQANPVIATSISRCIYKNGKIAVSGLNHYRDAAIKVAKAENVPVIDLKLITENQFNAMGEEKSFPLFMGKIEVVKKVKGKAVKTTQIDRTHLNKDGAMQIAQWFVSDCKSQKLPIADCFK